ncbi:hypothetical protein C5167_047362 [Papaver somniferum]|uniref:Uncharacterized protein n=1 Tax=Papaver somniferum TaxID=3469 RepID=A0A4Y7LHX0_PAPSO|nr:uncharacterized protein LOC113320479 [Papaver somniferum]XP_026424172.1 uncharacterized protein LOC113320479 [Papaver somniferum]RZC84577.1 hypothetical protein C5167_047362 [Papaver somniferum]
MVKPSTTTESTNYTVFVETSMKTHLVVTFTITDTAGHLKQKIAADHFNCFPKLGEIDVTAIKVTRNQCCYHVSDSMHVKSVFERVRGTWYLYVDAVLKETENVSNNITGSVGEASQLVLVVHSMHNLIGESIKEIGGENQLHGKQGEQSKVMPSEEKDLKHKSTLDTKATYVASPRKRPISKIFDGKTGIGLSNLGAGKDDSTRNVVPVADHPSKTCKSLPPIGKSKTSKVEIVGAPSSCLEKGPDKESLKTKQSISKKDEEPKKQNDVTSRVVGTSIGEKRKKQSSPLKNFTRSRTRTPAVSDNYSSTCAPKSYIPGQHSQIQ